jgi:hypothetical protein
MENNNKYKKQNIRKRTHHNKADKGKTIVILTMEKYKQ